MNGAVVLADVDWRILMEFVKSKTHEIAEFDDEDENCLAVMAVVAKIERQLGEFLQSS